MSQQLSFTKASNAAVTPTKALSSDAGYDLTIIRKVQDIDGVPGLALYTSGIKVQAPIGYHTEVVARSSFCKTGHMLANSVGIIDNGYRGEIMLMIFKFNPSSPDLTLPCRCAQLLIRKTNHMDLIGVEELDSTDRGERGFGSTN